jgi:hypothetical protein
MTRIARREAPQDRDLDSAPGAHHHLCIRDWDHKHMSRSIQPLLLDTSERLASGALEALSSQLLAVKRSTIANGSLGQGYAGVALAHHYLAACFPERPHATRARQLLELAVAHVPRAHLTTVQPTVSLFGGVTGVAWTVAHLTRRAGRADANPTTVAGETAGVDDLLVDVDEALLSSLEAPSWEGHFDVIDGLGGVAIYFLERLPRATAAAALGRIVEHLDALAVRSPSTEATGETVAWRSAVARGADVRSGFNMGVAHGTPGLIPVLAAIVKSGVCAPAAVALLSGAVRWVIRQRRDDTQAQFAGWLDECSFHDQPSDLRPFKGARSAWCYGAPGISAALLAAATTLGEAGWRQAALDIAHRAALRPMESCEVADAGLCHGAAGLGHIYRRIHHYSGESFAADAARRWFAFALEKREPARGIGGFLSVRRDRRGALRPQRDAGFLTGSSGIALSLASVLRGTEPEWDRVLGISTI